jgi:hypothetical protein
MRGMGSIEFKYSAGDGRLYAIEPTLGRTDLQSEAAVVNGCNLPAMHYYDLTEDKIGLKGALERARSSTQRRVWMRFGADVRSARSSILSGNFTLLEWLRPFRRPISFAVFRWNDPLPFVSLVFQRGGGSLMQAAKSILAPSLLRRAYLWRRNEKEGPRHLNKHNDSQTRVD